MSVPAETLSRVKRCKGCNETKPLAAFHRHSQMRDGHLNFCRDCQNAKTRERYLRDPSKRLASIERYEAKVRPLRAAYARDNRLTPEERAALHPLRNAERQRRWREAHPGLGQRRVRDWKSKYPERWAAHMKAGAHKRRGRQHAAAGGAGADAMQARIDYYGGRCWMCGVPGTELDHVIPLSKGGSNWPANLRPACRSCNARKGAGLSYS